MAIKRLSKDLVAQGSHRVKVSTVSTGPKNRKYQAACRDCTFLGETIGSGSKADKEAMAHAEETLKTKGTEAAAEEALEQEPVAAAS